MRICQNALKHLCVFFIHKEVEAKGGDFYRFRFPYRGNIVSVTAAANVMTVCIQTNSLLTVIEQRNRLFHPFFQPPVVLPV